MKMKLWQNETLPTHTGNATQAAASKAGTYKKSKNTKEKQNTLNKQKNPT